MPPEIARHFIAGSAVLLLLTAPASNLYAGVPTKVTGWFDDVSLVSTVLLEKQVDNHMEPLGTGFTVYNYVNPTEPIVVTCAHLMWRPEIFVSVVADTGLTARARRLGISSVEINGVAWDIVGSLLRSRVLLTKGKTFEADSQKDVAAFRINFGSSVSLGGSEVRTSPSASLSKVHLGERDSCSLGDETYFVGFPYGIGAATGEIRPVLRSGSVAWVDRDGFLLDAFSWGGNSGSPVFTKCTTERPYSLLIGMVTGHLGGDGAPNWGLASCVWVDDILRIVDRVESQRVK